MRAFARLKNRTILPQQTDYDAEVTLASLLEPGNDRQRWHTSRAAAVEGYVITVARGGIESANCYSLFKRDIHIEIALHPDAPPRERVVLEVTPCMREWAERQGLDWSESALARDLVGRWCYFEGWLFFDSGHAGESENIAPGRADNWRATAWEIHPVTKFSAVR
ncbi:MAG TPA: hypothetical protein VF747_01125 [Blastocatellia bacterium]|jgi:hypothetical protein